MPIRFERETCGTCVFYKQTLSSCRRFPPSVMVYTDERFAGPQFATKTPEVRYEDWCGEWEDAY